jgi:hypothetical protein
MGRDKLAGARASNVPTVRVCILAFGQGTDMWTQQAGYTVDYEGLVSPKCWGIRDHICTT